MSEDAKPARAGMTGTWGVIALVVLLAVLGAAWFAGLFDGEPTGTVLGSALDLAPPAWAAAAA